MSFRPASRTQRKLRMNIYGPTGSGKTLTSLLIAKPLAGDDITKVGVIDTERSSAEIYEPRLGKFLVCDLDHHAPEDFMRAMKDAEGAGIEVLVIDSLSHAWMGEGGVLDMADAKGGRFDAWKTLTPIQRKLIDQILTWPGHVITTMRAKTHYDVSKDERGKTSIERVGLAPVQKEGVEYEFDVVGLMDQANTLHILKSRFSSIKDTYRQPGADFAAKLMSELGIGEAAKPKGKPTPTYSDEERTDRINKAIGRMRDAKTQADADEIAKLLNASPDWLKTNDQVKGEFLLMQSRLKQETAA